jgi:hypothetical protein
MEIDFQWSRAYSKVSSDPAAYECVDGKIRQIGRGVQQYSPLKNKQLFLDFAQLDGSPGSCVSFAETWGLLSTPARAASSFEELHVWRREIKRMLTYIRMLPRVVKIANSRGTYARVAKIDVLLVPGSAPGSAPVLVMEPGTLLEAMNLQLALYVSGGNSLLTCQECHKTFQAGRGVKRSIAKFCGDECRNRYHNKRRVGK